MKKKFAIALVAVAIVLIGSLLYWQNQISDSKEPSQNSKASTNRATTSQNTVSKISKLDQSDGSPNILEYITIEEWGVKFQIPKLLEQDLSYEYIKDLPDVVRIYSKKYGTQPPCDRESGGFLGIHRGSQTVVDENNIPFKKIAGFDFYFIKTACESSSKFAGEVSSSHEKLKKNIKNSLAERNQL